MFIAIPVALAVSLSARAQAPVSPAPPPPPRIVVTATLAPIDAARAGWPVQILTGAELDAFGVRTAIDALRLAAGVDVRARGPHDAQADISFRGAGFGQALVLTDGLRLNDAQSGHHHAEIPVPMIAVDRIEVAAGSASAAHGADALGGTVQILTRRSGRPAAELAAGQHGLVDAAATASAGAFTVAAWGARDAGFIANRDVTRGGGLARGTVGRLSLDARHQRRRFGAAGFYGNSPSREWTDQTIAGAGWTAVSGRWAIEVRAAWKNHGDHFRWDVARPGFAENRHRTNGGDASVQASRSGGAATFTLGGSAGLDRVRSSNLGHHEFTRVAAFGEVRRSLGPRATAQAGLRVDRYSTFGTAVSPSAAAVLDLGGGWRLRAAGGRAFRVPTFTELYYTDPANLGRPDLHAESGWSLDTGADLTRGPWTGAVTVFGRWDREVIDWVRPTATALWRSTNVRDVTTRGVEASATRAWARARARAAYTRLDVTAPSLTLLSKYVLEYATDSLAVSVAVPAGRSPLMLSATVDGRRRTDGQAYALVNARASATRGRATVHVDASNLFDVAYREIAGVAMPGRWILAGVTLR